MIIKNVEQISTNRHVLKLEYFNNKFLILNLYSSKQVRINHYSFCVRLWNSYFNSQTGKCTPNCSFSKPIFTKNTFGCTFKFGGILSLVVKQANSQPNVRANIFPVRILLPILRLNVHWFDC